MFCSNKTKSVTIITIMTLFSLLKLKLLVRTAAICFERGDDFGFNVLL
jgi:predicted transposase YbfD/YdcC